MSMDLTTAIDLVFADTCEEDPEHASSAAEAVQWARDGMDHGDADGSVDDPRVREAYHVVLDASDAEIDRALR